ncbi:hypothetical protein ACFSL6_14265 [Paenibacillus thailandensis]|uniref:DUF1640 domain-containing protein n=1 Tax=Paenibacillus thailandensis TaxID=393250 RepID=A0ABW5R238_9BACL
MFPQREDEKETMIDYLASTGEYLAKQAAWLDELKLRLCSDAENILNMMLEHRKELEAQGETKHQLVAEKLDELQVLIEDRLLELKDSILRELIHVRTMASANHSQLEQIIKSNAASLTDRLDQVSLQQEKMTERKISLMSDQIYRIEQNMVHTMENARKGINHSLAVELKRMSRFVAGTAAIAVLVTAGLCYAVVKWMGAS